MVDELTLAKKRRKATFFYWGLFLFLLLLAVIGWMLFWRFRAYTNDSYVGGNQVSITPLRSGIVTSVHTDDTFLVEKGQILIELDKTDALIAFDRAKKELANTVREVCQSFHQVSVYKSEIEVKKAELVRTEQDYQHRADVIAAEGVSLEDYQHAVAFLKASYFSLKLTESLYKKALAFVQGTTLSNHPQILASAERFREAWVQLYRCTIYAPVKGLVAQRTIQVGMWVNPGMPLLSVIPLDELWVNANFKETQLKYMRIGQPARITSDLYGHDVVFHGTIVGLPGGAGNVFSLLPPQNLSGNWIKIVQRLPVRIALDPEEIIKHPLRVGLSLETIVNLTNLEGPLVPTTAQGSPLYQTPIFELEEVGNREAIKNIIHENIDPALAQYTDTPFIPFPDCEIVYPEIEKLISETTLPRFYKNTKEFPYLLPPGITMEGVFE